MTVDVGTLRSRLREALGDGRLRDEPDDLAYYGADRCRGGWPVRPSAVVLPRTIAEVQETVRICAALGVPIVPSGGRTGLAGAATATDGEVVLSLERLSRVLEVDRDGRTLRTEAGATLQTVQEAAAAEGLMYPVDYASKGSAQIGGSLATNAGGVKVIRYGLTRDWVSGMKVVLASGELLDLGGALVKNNTGYDLRQLFVGSEGTLGVIVEVTLRLCAPPAGTVVALAAVPGDRALLELFGILRRAPLTLAAFECFDHGCVAEVRHHRGSADAPFSEEHPVYALIEVESPGADEATIEATRDQLMEALADAQEAEVLADAVLAQTPAQGRGLWALREDISESLHRYTPFKADVSFPVAEVAAFLEAFRARVAARLPEIRALVFGHVGDGNLHLNLLRPEALELEDFLARCHGFEDELFALVRDHRGSISAEHGIGLLKRDHLQYSRTPAELEIMRGIKAVLDPAGLLNPGKIFRLG
jgi:FAD/FMN-containing dehydrogenase